MLDIKEYLKQTKTVLVTQDVFDELVKRASAQPEIIRCKDCKYFDYDHMYIIQGFPILGHEVCTEWGGGCKTSEDGYCFLAERRKEGEAE